MKVSCTKTIDLEFSVEFFQGTEGGMRNEVFSNRLPTVEEAVWHLQVAQAARPEENWIITAATK